MRKCTTTSSPWRRVRLVSNQLVTIGSCVDTGNAFDSPAVRRSHGVEERRDCGIDVGTETWVVDEPVRADGARGTGIRMPAASITSSGVVQHRGQPLVGRGRPTVEAMLIHATDLSERCC